MSFTSPKCRQLDYPQALAVRVVETDGIYDHQLMLTDVDSVASVPWYSRQRNTQRYRKRATAILSGLDEDDEGQTDGKKSKRYQALYNDALPPFPTLAVNIGNVSPSATPTPAQPDASAAAAAAAAEAASASNKPDKVCFALCALVLCS